MKLAIAKLPEFWRGITRNRDIERSAREWMEGYDAALAYCAEQLDQALSHAAGQDGEQCRAASVEPDAWLYEYEHDGESDHCLSRVRFLPSWVEAKRATEHPLYLRALSRGVPEGECTLGVGDGSGQLFVHGSYDAIKACQALILRGERDDWPKTVVVSSGDMCFTADWDGEYFVTRSPIKLDDAAIAAQRKEG